jgi:hypothetical protein
MRVDVVILQHGCHLIKGCIFLVERCVLLRPPHLAQQPLAGFKTAVLIVLLVLVSLLQKQDTDCEAENDDQGANDIWKKEWVGFEDGALEEIRCLRGLREDAAKGAAENGTVKKRSVGCRRSYSGESLPKAPHKGHDGISARYQSQSTINV